MNNFPPNSGFEADALHPPLGGGQPNSNVPPILLQYWNGVVRWRWLMIGIVVFCLAASVIVTVLTAPKYTAEVQIEISRQQKQITKVDGIDNEEAGRDQEFYATQYALLKTRPLMQRIVSELNLANSRQFFEAHGIDGDIVGQKFPGKTERQARDERVKLAVDLLDDNVSISPIRTSRLVNIDYTSRSPEISMAIANKWASSFISLSMDRQFASTADARNFLEQRLNSLRERLEESEKQVVLYASKSDIVSLDQIRDGEGRIVGNRTLTGANLEELASALNQATAARIVAESKSRTNGDTASEAISSPTIANLRQQRAQTAAEHAKLLTTFEPGYPAVQELAQQLRTIDAAIAQESRRIAGARSQEYREAAAREGELRAQVEKLKSNLDTQNRANIQYAIFQREADTNRQLYDGLLQRYKEIGVAGTIGANNIAIVDPAILPERPSSPNILINLAAALLLGITLAGLTALALEQIDEGVREPSQVERLLQLPLLGVTPMVENDVVEEVRDPKSPFFDAYFSIRSSLAFSTSHGFPKSLTVVSTRPSEGKSSTAFALSVILGRTNKRVLLVDGDLRSPSINSLMGISNERGFSNYLAGDNDWEQIVHETEFKNVFAIAAGPVPPSAAELLSGERLGQFVKEGLTQFDHIIIDSPPVLGMTDGPLIAKVVEGVVYVVQSSGVAARGVRASIDRLRSVNAHLFGVILTKLDNRQGGYGYGYGYGYGERYGAAAQD